MLTSWIKCFTSDHVELSSLLFEPEKKTDKIILHFHGKEGNFVQNRFIFEMKDKFPKAGISFMTVNQRGHDYMSDSLVKTSSGFEYKKIGFAYEVFEDCLKDIRPFVDEVISRGYRKIYLQGHSLPHRCIYYTNKSKDDRISGLINICQSDVLYEFKAYVQDYEDNLNLAKALVESGRGDQLMPVLLWSGAYSSAKNFLSYGDPKGNAQVFSFCDDKFEFKELKKIKAPCLYIEPETDFSMGIDPEEALDICKKETSKATRVDTVLIEGASHSFINFEDKLSEYIIDWVLSL